MVAGKRISIFRIGSLLTTLTVLLLLFVSSPLNNNNVRATSHNTYLEYGGTHTYGPAICNNATYSLTDYFQSADFPTATKKIIGILSNNSLANGSGAGHLRTLSTLSNSLNNYGYAQINDSYYMGPFLDKKWCHIDTGLNASNYGFSSFSELCNAYGYGSTPYISNLRDYWTQNQFTIRTDARSSYCNYPTISPKGNWTGSYKYYFLIEGVPPTPTPTPTPTCVGSGSCLGPGESCCSGLEEVFDPSCGPTEVRCMMP